MHADYTCAGPKRTARGSVAVGEGDDLPYAAAAVAECAQSLRTGPAGSTDPPTH